MANRRISELPELLGVDIAEQDLLTIVHVFEVDPTLKNKKLTVSGFNSYLRTKYIPVTGGVLTGDILVNGNLQVTGSTNVTAITGTSSANFNSVIVQTNLQTLETISGKTITGVNVLAETGTFGNIVFSSAITGPRASFTSVTGTSGVFTSQLSGATVTGNTALFTNITGINGVFTSNISGATINSPQISGAVITGTTVNATTGVFQVLTAINQSFAGNLTFSGDTYTQGSGYFSSGISVTGTVNGNTITGNSGLFTDITGNTLRITAPSGSNPAIICSGVVSGSTNGFIIQGPLIIL